MGGDGTVPLLFSIKDQDGNSLMIVDGRLSDGSLRDVARSARRPGAVARRQTTGSRMSARSVSAGAP